MTIGEYRKQLYEDIRNSAEDGFYEMAHTCLVLLWLIHDLDKDMRANFLTYSEIVRVGDEAASFTNAEYEAGHITDWERAIMYHRFFAHAEASKLQGSQLDLDAITAAVTQTEAV